MVDTTAYDMLLGMEFMRAFNGVYDSYTELFSYRWRAANGNMRSHSISAPCHTNSPPVVAYACFAVLNSSAEELQDVQGSCEDTIPEDDDWGYHTSPSQLAAAQLSRKAQAVEKAAEVRARKEVRGRDLARRENAAARLASVSPLSLPPLLPSSS